MPIRILIVDDIPITRQHILALLQDIAGWEVCGEAVDGRDAISKTQELSPDVIVLDLVMPGMNGLETAREIKKRAPQIPTLMCTTFLTPELIEEARNVGIRGIVDKIYAGSSLANGIRALLRKETFFPCFPAELGVTGAGQKPADRSFSVLKKAQNLFRSRGAKRAG